MPWMRNDSPTGVERVISALCYLSGGIVGIIYIIVSRSANQSSFFRFHFLQSIVLAILSLLLNWAFGALSMVMGPVLPWFGGILSKVMSAGMVESVLSGLLLLINSLCIAWSLLSVYGLIWAALGKYAEIPFISNVVRQQMR